jgi:hypothetical protein
MGRIRPQGATMAIARNGREEEVPKERIRHWMRWAYMKQREDRLLVRELALVCQVRLSFILFILLSAYIVAYARRTLLLLHPFLFFFQITPRRFCEPIRKIPFL